jgi:hypothetical protein
MKMVKKTLIALAAVVLLSTVAQAALEEYYFGKDKNKYVKVDGNQKVRWPFEYKALTVCSIPVKMSLGMWVEVEKCTDSNTKIVLEQVDCGDIGQGSGDFPCYLDCVSFRVRANFDVKMGGDLHKNDAGNKVIDSWDWYYNGDDVVPGDGEYHSVEVCVKAWKAMLYKGTPGDEVTLGSLDITAKPNV